MSNPKNNIDIFDVTKFILSIIIVAMHTTFAQDKIFPWARIAVPLFFMISSYLFFSKQNRINIYSEKKAALKNYITRNIILYAFWFVVLIPFIIYIRDEWFDDGVILGILQFFRDLIFSSTFTASWFISAQIIAITIIFFAGRKINNTILAVAAAFIYILIVLSSAYYDFISSNEIIAKAITYYEIIFTEGALSFPVAFVWCTIGKIFADTSKRISILLSVTFTIISGILLYIEWKFVYLHTGNKLNDCLFSLIFLCPLLFDLIRRINIKLRFAKQLRLASIITFVSHGAAIIIVRKILFHFSIYNAFYLFAGVILSCICLTALIMLLENKKLFKFLRYSH